MSLRSLLVALVVAATAAFVVSVSIERGNEPAQTISIPTAPRASARSFAWSGVAVIMYAR